jgi:membrane fusion protein, heavy metal efflux system
MRSRIAIGVLLIVALGAALGGGWWGWRQWQATQAPAPAAHEHGEGEEDHGHGAATSPVKLSAQARKNLGLVSKPLAPATYWRTLELPGVVVDRPGVSDRGVVAPIAGTVTQIHIFPGSTVAPNDPLFTIRLVSESLHTSQLELYKATREIDIAKRQRERLTALAESGAIAKSRIIELDNQIERAQATVDAYRQDLQARGLPADRIDVAAKGEFVTEMTVRAPSDQIPPAGSVAQAGFDQSEPGRLPFSFELQSLDVQLGEQVEAGRVLCHLADHRSLLIEGRGFNDDLPLIQEAARNGWEVEIQLETAAAGNWPPLPKKLKIDHLSNAVDHETHTFSFFLPLENQWQTYTQNAAPRLLWRFRPGNHLRLRVPVEKLENVFVVPRQAVVREGPEAYIFRQNGDLFDRLPVHLLHEDRQFAVLANDGAVRKGMYLAQSGAASINRVFKAQSATGAPAGMHVHADGSVHGAH